MMQEPTTERHAKTFSVFIPDSDDVRRVEGRSSAIREAKSLSREQSYPVRVKRDDGCVKMTFRDGELVRYGFDRHS